MLTIALRKIGLCSALLLLLLLGSCASYHPAVLPGSDSGSKNIKNDEQALDEIPVMAQKNDQIVVRIGSKVRVGLNNGETLSGAVVRISEKELVLGKVGNFGPEETVISVIEINSLEVEKDSTAASITLTGLGILLAGFITMAMLLTYGGLGGSSN